MRTFTKHSLTAELERARTRGWLVACSRAEQRAQLPKGLLLAIASQETDMNDVVGDQGHGRGLFQIDDRSHGRFLASHGADRPGGKPPLEPAARYAATLLTDNLAYGRRQGVRETDLLKFAVSAYNAGPGGALQGYRAGDSDRRTTGGDYSRSVLGRLAIFQELLNGAGPSRLRRGMRNARVAELKETLAAWYSKHAPGEFEAHGVRPGPYFGMRLEQAVIEFQRRVGLEADGIAGPKTLEALAKNRRPSRP